MKGDPKVLEILNDVLTGELTAINQYFLHARMCKDWGFKAIADQVWKESIEEMKHAQNLTDRILFLEGMPNLQRLGKLNIGETIPEQFESDLKLEMAAVDRLRKGIAYCYECGDHPTRELLEHILADEEEHIDWIETQLGLIEKVGKEQYLAEQMKS